MNSSDPEKQDQSGKISGMEDTTTMTVEFLRARLLSERAVSKSARQRADELAKRVAELEEQLRIVSLQRLRAERATADVLAILESNGISDASEGFDSSSEQEYPHESKVDNKSSKEDENSVNSKVRRNESEDLSGSDFEFSRAPSRSLSWKGRRDGSRSLEKCKDPSLRRRSSFASVGYSPKHHRPGKSCRQIKRKESKSVSEEVQANTVNIDSPENAVANTSDVSPNFSDFGPTIVEGAVEVRDNTLMDGQLSDSVENEQIASGNNLGYSLYGRDRDMEKALEHQAQLIGQFEEMEKAQREWEEKFREINSSTPDSFDPGNRSDVTEERYEIKAQPPEPDNRAKSEGEDFAKIQSNGILSDGQSFLEQKSSRPPVSESSTQDVASSSMAKVNKKQDNHGHLAPISPSNAGGSFGKESASSENRSESYALVLHNAPKELDGVLDALKQARQQLQQKINNRFPLIEGGSAGKSVESSAVSTISRDKAEFPVGCVGLFRLPTDISTAGNTRANFLSSSTRLSLGNCYPDMGVAPGMSNQLVTSSDPFTGIRNRESESRIVSQRPYYDPAGLAPAGRESIDPYSSFQEMIPSRGEGFSSFLSGRSGAGVAPADNFAFSAADYIRPNMYRY